LDLILRSADSVISIFAPSS